MINEREWVFFLPGEPTALKRARMGKSWSGRSVVYDSQHSFKNGMKFELVSQLPSGFKPIETACQIEYEFQFGLPTTWSKKKKREKIGMPHTSRPDLDNLEKMGNDLLSGLVLQDDKLIYQCFSKKFYCETGQTIIRITY